MVAFPRPSVRPTRRPTADPAGRRDVRRTRAAAGPGDTALPPCPPVARDRGRSLASHGCGRHGRHGRQRGLDPASRPGGPQPHGGPLYGTGPSGCRRYGSGPQEPGRTAAGPAGGSGGLQGVARPQGPQVQGYGAPLQPVQQPRQLLRAARGHQQLHPVPAQGLPESPARDAGAPERPPRPARPARRTAPPASSRSGRPGTVGQPRSFSYQCRARASGPAGENTGRRCIRIEGPAGKGDRGGHGDRANHAKCNRRIALRVTLGALSGAQSAGKGGAWGVRGGARLFAHSGANRCAPHGVSVPAGKTCLVGGGDTQDGASHVRHRRTGDWGNCLACGNIVSHHRVGADVGVTGQEAIDGVGSWNERSPLAGLSCGRTGRGKFPHCLTALRSD